MSSPKKLSDHSSSDCDSDISYVLSTSSGEDTEYDDEDKLGLYEDIEIEEIEECRYFSKCQSTYSTDSHIFTTTRMAELKDWGRELIDRNTRGYYRSKTHHPELYKNMKEAYITYKNMRLASVRQSSEHIFAFHSNTFELFNIPN